MARPQRQTRAQVIDLFALGISHLLLALAAIRLLSRDDLDRENAPGPGPDKAPGE